MNKMFLKALSCFGMMSLLGTSASAATLVFDSLRTNSYQTFYINKGATSTTTAPVNTTAGLLNIRVDGSSYSAYCFDLFTGISAGTNYTVTANTPAANTNQARAAWAIANYLGTFTQAYERAALQLAVWDIIHDSGNGLAFGSGRVQISTTSGKLTPTNISTLASSIITASVGKSYTRGTFYTANGMQTLYVSDVPEPATIFLSGGALAALVAWKRRQQGTKVS
jgi:PEP-CTERM motif/Thioester domain